MIRYLIDSSALWRILREPAMRVAWSDVVVGGGIGSCQAQRSEFRRSARNAEEFEQMSAMFADLYPDVSAPKGTWAWVESAQYRLVRSGAHRALSCVDLLVAAVAAQRGLVVLHDDTDFVAAAAHLTELRQRNVRDVP